MKKRHTKKCSMQGLGRCFNIKHISLLKWKLACKDIIFKILLTSSFTTWAAWFYIQHCVIFCCQSATTYIAMLNYEIQLFQPNSKSVNIIHSPTKYFKLPWSPFLACLTDWCAKTSLPFCVALLARKHLILFMSSVNCAWPQILWLQYLVYKLGFYVSSLTEI